MVKLTFVGTEPVTVKYIEVFGLEQNTFHDNDLLLTYLHKSGNSNSNTSYNKIQAVLICSLTHCIRITFSHYLQHAVTYTMVLDNINIAVTWKKLENEKHKSTTHLPDAVDQLLFTILDTIFHDANWLFRYQVLYNLYNFTN